MDSMDIHYQLSGHEFEQTLGDSEELGSLACCNPWGHKRVGHDSVTEQQTTHVFTGKMLSRNAKGAVTSWRLSSASMATYVIIIIDLI